MPHWNTPPRVREGDPLTDREQEILALLSTGASAPGIAERLGITLDMVKTHITSVHTKTGAHRDSNPLTTRELEILALLAAGYSTPAIGELLGISQGTVKAHLTNVYRKIGAKNRVQAARYYLDHLAPRSDG